MSDSHYRSPGHLFLSLIWTLLVCVTTAGQALPHHLNTLQDGSLDPVVADSLQVFEVKHREKRRLMFPGTKWCGDGDTASSYDDLGSNVKIDRCCRDHDHCNDTIPTKTSKRGLKNLTPYTRLNCECDDQFRECLRNISNFASGMVGNLYFDVSKAQCFRLDYPANCTDRDSHSERCLEYTYDTSMEKVWQFFDQLPWKQVNRDKVKKASNDSKTMEDTTDLNPTSPPDDSIPLTSSATFLLGASGSCTFLMVLGVILVVYRRTCYTAGVEYTAVSTIEDKVPLS